MASFKVFFARVLKQCILQGHGQPSPAQLIKNHRAPIFDGQHAKSTERTLFYGSKNFFSKKMHMPWRQYCSSLILIFPKILSPHKTDQLVPLLPALIVLLFAQLCRLVLLQPWLHRGVLLVKQCHVRDQVLHYIPEKGGE